MFHPEGITYVGGTGNDVDLFAMLDEETGNIFVFHMDAIPVNPTAAFDIPANSVRIIPTGLGDPGNRGAEGVAYDGVGGFYVVKERDPGKGIYWVEDTPTNPQVDFLTDPAATDLSGLYLEADYLYVV